MPAHLLRQLPGRPFANKDHQWPGHEATMHAAGVQGALHVGVDLAVLLSKDSETVQRDQRGCARGQIKVT